jgi:hypothetical protein
MTHHIVTTTRVRHLFPRLNSRAGNALMQTIHEETHPTDEQQVHHSASTKHLQQRGKTARIVHVEYMME